MPPIAGLARPIAAARRLKLAREAVDAPGPIVLVNSFASGGALFSVVLRASGGVTTADRDCRFADESEPAGYDCDFTISLRRSDVVQH